MQTRASDNDAYLRFCPGPAPARRNYTEEQIARVALLEYELRAGNPLAEEDVDLLLGYITEVSRATLDQYNRVHNLEGIDTAALTGSCGLGRDTTALLAVALGFQTKLVQLGDLPSPNNQHAVTVVRVPIIKEDIVTEQFYVLDPTFRQYFCGIEERRYGRGSVGGCGPRLINELGGEDVAATVLEQGWVEITDGTRGALYIRANSLCPDLRATPELLDQLPSHYTNSPTAFFTGFGLPSHSPSGAALPEEILQQPNGGWVDPKIRACGPWCPVRQDRLTV